MCTYNYYDIHMLTSSGWLIGNHDTELLIITLSTSDKISTMLGCCHNNQFCFCLSPYSSTAPDPHMYGLEGVELKKVSLSSNTSKHATAIPESCCRHTSLLIEWDEVQ